MFDFDDDDDYVDTEFDFDDDDYPDFDSDDEGDGIAGICDMCGKEAFSLTEDRGQDLCSSCLTVWRS
jgi:hypothetical protein